MMTERMVPDDAMLIRYIDNEATEAERTLVENAVAADTTLATRLAQLEHRSSAARAAIASEDVPVPPSLNAFDAPPRTPRTWLRAALLIGALGVGAFAVPPVRAWILDAFGRSTDRNGAVVQPPAPVVIDTVGIFFDAPPEFLIELEAAQRNGRLIVSVADVGQAGAELRTPGGTESFFVTPEGLQIVNGDVSTAEYEITLPRTVRDVRIRIPGRADVTYATSGNERRVFELGR